jgi:serine/threonine protein kinase
MASILDFDVFDLADQALDAYPEPTPLADFSPYRIEKRIDQGGMGEVWRASDQAAQRTVAIKIPRYLSDPRLRERFVREVHNLFRLVIYEPTNILCKLPDSLRIVEVEQLTPIRRVKRLHSGHGDQSSCEVRRTQGRIVVRIGKCGSPTSDNSAA